MRILCVDSDPARASAIAASLEGTADACALDAMEPRLAGQPGFDGVVLEAGAFQSLDDAAAQRLRTAARSAAWIVVSDDPDRVLTAGADGAVSSSATPEQIGTELRRAVSARRDRQRWPRSFVERRALLVSDDAALGEALAQAGFTVESATDRYAALVRLRRSEAQTVVIDATVDRRIGNGGGLGLLGAVQRFDPAIGCALFAASAEDALAARAAGAAAVSGKPSPVSAVDLAEQAWLAWCRGPRDAGLVLGIHGDAPDVVQAARAAGFSCVAHDGGRVDALLLVDGAPPEHALLATVPTLVLSDDVSGVRARLPWAAVARVADPEDLRHAFAELAARARDGASLRAMARRLHEVDTRRVELIKKLADAQLELEHLATIDGITETLNRRGTEDALSREIEVARRTGGSVASCLVETDGIKRIRGEHGLRTADEVLRVVAERLRRALRLTDAIGRVGEEHFFLLLPQTRIAEAVMVADRARDAVAREPVRLDVERTLGAVEALSVTVSVGVAVLPWEVAGLEDALALTQSALDHSRSAQSDHPSAAASGELDVLVDALARGEGLSAVAQPIMRLSDEKVVGYEMLARGRPGPYEAPLELLRLARQRGVLTPVDLQCLRTCLEAARQLGPDLTVHINLFPTTLLDMSVEEVVRTFTEAIEAPLCLELSEEQFVGDARDLLERIGALRSAGVRLAIDDVGKGRGTLDSVMLLEPDLVKIDKELIDGACSDVRKERLLRRLVALAATMGCEVVGEGVERSDDLELLRELDVPYAQGFLWAEPRMLS